MILDYYYNEKQRRFDISYVDDRGGKQLLQFNVNRFKSFYKTPTGPYDSWDGAKCDVKWTEKPSNFDLKYYMKEMDPQYKSLLEKKTFPKVYTFDIETWIPEDNEFPEPSTAKFPITTISIVSPEMNCVVLATRELNQDELKYVSDSFDNYLDNTAFFKELKLSKKPSFKYIKFDTEEQMLEFFLKNIVARVPIIAGWNSLFFDWYYITTRIKNYYPNLSVRMASITNRTYNKRLVDVRGDAIYLPMPEHTLILDMMDVIKSEDYVVLPIKESYGLDYIAHESMGINKIEYDGTLQDLYNSDYPKYVYYNAIDSILVQLIDKRFKTLDHIYMYSLYCEEKIGRCFSKIATTEALVFQDFYERGLKIVYEPKEVVERGHLIGAYVKKPIPGLHEFVCCNDFASLYPSTIRTCNLSFENFICSYWDQKKIAEYAEHPEKYIIIGPNVFKNEGTLAKPATGVQIDTCLDEEKLAPYRENKDYFVSVNGSIYKNDKDYTFRRIQGQLKANRDSSKYLAKQLEATVILDMEHILAGRRPNQVYNERIKQALKKIDVEAECGEDLLKYDNDFLSDKMHELKSEITYYSCHEQAMKLLMNSMYGGSSHVSFYWFNMELANDITGESRNLIHSMENHIPAFWRDNWTKMTDLHKKLGIEIDPKAAEEALLSSPLITKEQDPNAFHDHSYVYAAYGDTDSLYLSYGYLLRSIKGYKDMSIEQKRDIVVRLNTEFLDNHNYEFIKNYYDKRHGKSVHNFELETVALSGIWGEVKKRYAQILLWKDGKVFDIDNLPLKVKGLEVVKSSFPRTSRNMLKQLYIYLLSHAGEKYLIQNLNLEVQKLKKQFFEADVESISGSVKVNGYKKYIKSDNEDVIKYNPVRACPWNTRALATYNWLRNKYKLSGEAIQGGLVKWYICNLNGMKSRETEYFAFHAANLPKWSQDYAPIDRAAMFQQTVLDPINRMLAANKIPLLNIDGYIQMSLF